MKIIPAKIFGYDSVVLIPICAGLILYFRTIGFEFTRWDDFTFIVNNRSLQGFSLGNIMDILIPGRIVDELIYIPMTYLSYLLEISIMGAKSSVIHFDNLLLHLVNIFLVYVFAKMLTGETIISFFASLFFAVHPLQVESVAWCMGRKDLISTFFALISLIAFYRCMKGDNPKQSPYICSLVMFFLAVFAKPAMFLLPLFFVPLLVYMKGRLSRDMIIRIIPFLIVSAMSFYLNSRLDSMHVSSDMKYVFYRMTFIPAVFEGWVQRFFLLERPSAVYEWSSVIDGRIITGTGLVLLISMSVLLLYSMFRNLRILWLGLFFSLIGFLPSLSYLSISYRDYYTADRYGYFPLIGVFLVLTALPCLFSNKVAKKTAIVVLAVFALSAGVSSWNQIGTWRNGIKLWEGTLAVNPDSHQGNYGLAREYFDRGDYRMAEKFMNKAKQAFPSSDCYYMLGVINENAGNNAAAMINYGRAVSLEPGLLPARKRLGLLYCYSGQHGKGLGQFTKIIEIAPDIPDTYFYCSRAFQALGNKEMAEQAMKTYEDLKRGQDGNHPPR